MFHSAHHIVISGSKFIDASPPSNGLKELLKYSMPDAFHDSSARYPPPKCHPSTRKDYIDEITKWALSTQGRVEPILWLYGPFGVGKSAIAQSCAMYLERATMLAATLFFSRANPNREDPNRVFASIAYQIATKCQVFSEILDTRIQQDPAVFTKSLPKQFEELLVQPLKQVGSATRELWLEGGTVIIDGLDECKGAAAQHAIVDIIATSVRDQTTPFRWFITSRSEANIFRTMKSSAVSAVSSHLELPVSREIDYQILLYLTDEFAKIREFHQLLPSWPSEDNLALLVAHAAGLFIYAATIIRFINDENSFGPEDQLRIVLKYVMTVSAKAGEANPLAEMDSLYILIVERIPPNLRLTVKRILFIHSLGSYFQGPITIASILNISVDQFRRCCTFIQSVMELRGETLNTMSMHFYHTSFLDFMKDPKRSKEFCIRGDFLIEYRRELLEWLHEVCSRSTDPSNISLTQDLFSLKDCDRNEHYSFRLYCFWRLCDEPKHSFDFSTATSFAKLPIAKALRLQATFGWTRLTHVRDNLPAELSDKIVRRSECPKLGCKNNLNVWILGHGENETVLQDRDSETVLLKNTYDPPHGLCICGFPISGDGINVAIDVGIDEDLFID